MMPRRDAKVTQDEITRTIKAAAASGLAVGSFVANHRTGEVTVFAKGEEPSRGVAEIDKALGIS